MEMEARGIMETEEIREKVRESVHREVVKREQERLARTENWWVGVSVLALYVIAVTAYRNLEGGRPDWYFQQNMGALGAYLFFCGSRLWAKDEPEHSVVFIILAPVVGMMGSNDPSGTFAPFIAGSFVGVGIVVSLVLYWRKRQRQAQSRLDGH